MKIIHVISKLIGLPFGAVKPFPEISEIFSDDLEQIKEILFPICSIDLSYVNRKWTGKIYLLQFNEDPYNPETVIYFNQYCKASTLGFIVNNSKYKFDANLHYFDVTPQWQEWLELTKSTYLESKRLFQVKGKKFWMNFIVPGGKPRWLQEDGTPLDPDGNPMIFIAQYDSSNICKDYCEKEIYLFYSDKHKIAVQVYQTS